MSFSADQFMQVKCRFQLCSEPDSFDSIYSNTERIRLCDSISIHNDSVLIVMICSNECGNNHIVAYYMEPSATNNQESIQHTPTRASPQKSPHNLTLSSQIDIQDEKLTPVHSKVSADVQGASRSRIIVKQIYYHNYNEDIVAICFNSDGSKLILINAASTIYLLPIKNILLNSHAKQLKSSQAKSMYFYDATILHCCMLSQPSAIACWTSFRDKSKSTIVVGNSFGQLSFIDVEKKMITNECHVSESITSLKVIKDMYSYSLLITCDNLKQYRLTLDLTYRKENLNERTKNDFVHIEKDLDINSDRKPIPICFNGGNSPLRNGVSGVFTRVLSSSRRSSLFSTASLREQPSSFMMHDANSDLVVLIDSERKQTKSKTTNSLSIEAKFLHFYDSDKFYYMPNKPVMVCKLSFLNSNELINDLVVTDRLLAVTTNHDRCLICSKNCCNLKNSGAFTDLEPLVKEITFSTEEKILKLLKSSVSNDNDGIIDSFLLVTERSIYSVEARQSCRDMFVNLIDTHLNIRPQLSSHICQSSSLFNTINSDLDAFEHCPLESADEDTNLIVKSFLRQRDEVYDRITYDGSAFSILFKLELNSLYEAYGDKLLCRYQFKLAKKFFQMAKFDRSRILEKFWRLASQKEQESELSFLQYITLQEVTRELVKDVDLWNDLMGYSMSKTEPHGKYAHAALRHLDYFNRLSSYHRMEGDTNKFSKQQTQAIESVFIMFLEAAVDNSTDDTRWIWFIYIKFYLDNIGSVDELEIDILRLLDSNRIDCRYVVAFYMAIGQENSNSTQAMQLERTLFKNEFLLRLLEKSLSHLKDDTVYHENFLDFSMRCCA